MDKDFTLENFAAWIAKQPKRKKYDAGCYRTCLVAQFGRTHGLEDFSAPYRRFMNAGLEDAIGKIAYTQPHTFGSAARRARSLATQGRE